MNDKGRERLGLGMAKAKNGKAKYDKGPGAALSTRSASCQGETPIGYLGYPHGVDRKPRAWYAPGMAWPLCA